VACTSGTPPIPYDTHPMLIGADTDNGGVSGFWTGTIDEVRLFSAVRTSAEIWADMHTHKLSPTGAALVGEWTFDEGAGQTTADQSGAGNTGTLGATNAVETTDPTWAAAGAPY
ncbi:MAG TPA: LamG-like jellyroll fold domain-containing protein, partial [Polyangia bacterium]